MSTNLDSIVRVLEKKHYFPDTDNRRDVELQVKQISDGNWRACIVLEDSTGCCDEILFLFPEDTRDPGAYWMSTTPELALTNLNAYCERSFR